MNPAMWVEGYDRLQPEAPALADGERIHARYLTLRDRSKDLIISGGMNIYPRDVEEALLRHPGVRAAAVVGCADPECSEAVALTQSCLG